MSRYTDAQAALTLAREQLHLLEKGVQEAKQAVAYAEHELRVADAEEVSAEQPDAIKIGTGGRRVVPLIRHGPYSASGLELEPSYTPGKGNVGRLAWVSKRWSSATEPMSVMHVILAALPPWHPPQASLLPSQPQQLGIFKDGTKDEAR